MATKLRLAVRPEAAGRWPLLWVTLWLLIVLVALATRTLWPIDETRYATVAWEMWLRGDFLVPQLNGLPYSHKPPLLFWLFQAGWWLFGVNDLWPRIVPALFALLNLFLTARLARQLWPEQPNPARYAPLVLLGCLTWTFYTTVVLFDMLLTSCVLLGLSGILLAWRQGGIRGWLWLGLAIGLGLLAKGPIILLHTLPLALLAPWWTNAGGKCQAGQSSVQPDQSAGSRTNINWKRWYTGVLGAFLLGAALGLAWAIPAARAGGPEYAQAILWGQTTERLVESVAHARPWWWYLLMLPLLLFPWSVWPPLWRGIRLLRNQLQPDPAGVGVRFCVAWLAPVFLSLSLISGKQVHYMLPLLPGFALLLSHMACLPGNLPHRRDSLWLGLCMVAGGLLAALAPILAVRYLDQEDWIAQLGPFTGLMAAACGAALLLARKLYDHSLVAVTLASVALLIVACCGVLRAASPLYDIKPVAIYLKGLQDAGYTIAQVGDYYGQYQFLGRLQQPLVVIDGFAAPIWSRLHARGKIITYADDWRPGGMAKPEYERDYRGIAIQIWDRNAFLPVP